MEKIKFPKVVDTDYETTTILSFDDLIERIEALEHIQQTCPHDWEISDIVMLDELEDLHAKCVKYGHT